MSEPTGKNKKERVLHTRISEALDRELRSKAEELGVSVSKLVRNALSNTIDLVENIVVDSARVADNARVMGSSWASEDRHDPAMASSQPSANEVIGWQEVILNMNAVCVTCNDILVRGSQGAVGLTRAGAGGGVMCLACLATLRGAQSTSMRDEEP